MAARRWMCRALGVVGWTALGLAPGCVEDGVSLHGICPVLPMIDEDMCTLDPSSDTCVVDGVLNVNSATQYRLDLRVESGLKPRERTVPPVAEPNGAQMTHARVEIRDPASGGVWDFKAINDAGVLAGPENPFNTTASGYVEPGGTVIVPITVLTQAHIDRIRASNLRQFIAAVKVHATTNGAEKIESAEYAWPIRVVETSSRPSDGECFIGSYCVGSLGQDNFAQICGTD